MSAQATLPGISFTELNAADAAAALHGHFVEIDVATTQPSRTKSGRNEDFGIDEALRGTLDKIGRKGGFSLLPPEFQREFDRRRKAAQRARDDFSLLTNRGKHIVPQARLSECLAVIDEHISGLEQWKIDNHDTLEDYANATRREFDEHYRTLRLLRGHEQAEDFRNRILPHIATAEEMMAARITREVYPLSLAPASLEGLDEFSRAAAMESTNNVAMDLARFIPARIAREMVVSLDSVLRADDDKDLPKAVRERCAQTARFAADNNFPGDPAVVEGVELLGRITSNGASRTEIEQARSRFAAQEALYRALDQGGEVAESPSPTPDEPSLDI